MTDSMYFAIPFATSGDKTTIPQAVQPSGAISFTQGFGPDYERDPTTDPLAKRVPRNETNEYLYEITNAIKFLQLYGTPEWYHLDLSGNTVSYPINSRVRYDAGAGMQLWQSLIAANTVTPGSDATKWQLQDTFNLALLEATLAESLTGTIGTKIITPRRLASAAQRGSWNYVAAGGTVNAITATLAPAPAALTAGIVANLVLSGANTATPVTLNVNGLGAVTVLGRDGGAINIGDLTAGIATFIHNGTNWIWMGRQKGQLINIQTFTASGTYTPTPGTGSVDVTLVGAGGGGGGTPATTTGQSAIGSGGSSGQMLRSRFTTGFAGAAITIGAGGAANSGTNGGNGGSTSFGALATAVGGNGGAFGIGAIAAFSVSTGPQTANTGNVYYQAGNPGGPGTILTPGTQQYSGMGASGPLGGGGGQSTSSGNGGAGFPNSGAGGAGGARLASQGASSGGAGGSGLCIIMEYA